MNNTNGLVLSSSANVQKEKRRGPKEKVPRTVCPICKQPAVAYPQYRYTKDGTRKKVWVFEHRDEAPIRDYLYRGRIYKIHRRCQTRTIDDNINLDTMISKAQKFYKSESEDTYKKLYLQLLDEYTALVQEGKRVKAHFPDPRKGDPNKGGDKEENA